MNKFYTTLFVLSALLCDSSAMNFINNSDKNAEIEFELTIKEEINVAPGSQSDYKPGTYDGLKWRVEGQRAVVWCPNNISPADDSVTVVLTPNLTCEKR